MASALEPRESHLISLKVMRLSRPSLVMKQGVFFDKDHRFKATATAASNTTTGLEPNTTSILTDALSDLSLTQLERVHPPSSLAQPYAATASGPSASSTALDQEVDGQTMDAIAAAGGMQAIDLDSSAAAGPLPEEVNIGDFGLSELLALPASFGNIYLGETFTSYICANNESSHPVRDVILKAELQTSTLRFTLSDTLGGIRHQQQKLMNATTADSKLSPKPSTSLPTAPHSPTSPGGHVQLLESGKTNEMVVSHEIKELGIHILVCSVQYTTLDGQQKSFRKFYKFQVMNPLSVKTKVNQISTSSGTLTMPTNTSSPSIGGMTSDTSSNSSSSSLSGQKTIAATSQSGKVLLEAMIQNMSGVTLWMERMKFEAAGAFTVEDLNVVLDEHGQPVQKQKIPKAISGQEQQQQSSPMLEKQLATHTPATAAAAASTSASSQPASTAISIFGEQDYFAPNEVRQYLYLLQPRPGKELMAKTTNVLGKMDILWRSPMGESARLQTSPLTRHPAPLQKIAVQVVYVPERVRLEEIFSIELAIQNQSLDGSGAGASAGGGTGSGDTTSMSLSSTLTPTSSPPLPPPPAGSTRLFETVAAGGSALPTRLGDVVRPPTAVSRGPSLTRMDSSSTIGASSLTSSQKRMDGPAQGSDASATPQTAPPVQQHQPGAMKLMLTGIKQKMGSVLLSGANSRQLGTVPPGGEVRVKLDWFPLTSGVQKIGGLRIVDIVSGFTLELDHLTFCFVDHT
ncbi:hypothetical protein BGZ73_001562 [Actinomortierella ambigua]|nr:hypothetical protein BGZ73_001562 [Actinomortierella ambigua]